MSDITKMYCGVNQIPKGKIRGTPEYCVQTNQVRYYGIVAIDPKLLKTAKGKTTDLIDEKLKLAKIQSDVKLLLKEYKRLKIILENKNASKSEIKKANKQLDKLLEKRDKLVVKLKKQGKIVEQLEKAQKKEEKAVKKKKK